MLDTPPEEALKMCHLVPDVRFNVLVCGGDGTVGWVLRTIEEAALKVRDRGNITDYKLTFCWRIASNFHFG